MNHDTIVELLPWYVNGTLPPHEQAAVESELARCPLCAAELAELQKIHAALHEIEEDAPGPSETLYARTLARIEATPAEPRRFSVRAWWQTLSAPGKVVALAPAALAIVFLIISWSALYHALRPAEVAEQLPQNITVERITMPTQSAVRSNAPADTYSRAEQPKTVGAITTRSAASIVQAQAGGPVAAPVAPPAGGAGVAQLQQNAVSSLAKQGALQVAPPLPSGFQRPQLIRTGSISLLVPDVERSLAQVSNIAQLQFGDVVSLSDETPTQPGLRHTAEIQISVPSDRFDAALNSLDRIGAVQSRSINAENVTDQIVDAQARLRNLRRTEADMLKIMDRSGKIPDVLEVTQQVADVRQQIEQLDAQLQSMQHRVAYSTITVDVEDEKPVTRAAPSMGTRIGDAWKSALLDLENFSVKVVAALLVLVAFAPYWLLIALIALFVANRLRKPQV